MTLEPVREPLLRRAFRGRAMRNVSKTQAVDPLPHAEEEQTSEMPDTYPVGM